ncbi:MAG: hypothetical protein ACRELU_14415 [Gemmatimonadota bacterium]
MILHLWQATQIVIDVAVALCVDLHLGTPASYADAFRRLQHGGRLDEDLDMARVFEAASRGPQDLLRFLAIARDLLEKS